MRGMGNVSEIFQAPPPGTYAVQVALAEAGVSTKGNSQIVLTLEVIDGKFKGEQFLDWVGTDPSAKGAGIGRGKLRILLKGTQYDGLADAGDNNEVPDTVIAQALLGKRLFAVIENSPRKLKDENGKRTDVNMTQLDPATGNLLTIMNADVKGYTLHQAALQQTQQPAAQSFTAPQGTGYAAAPSVAAAPAQGQQSFAAPGTAAPTGLPFQPNFQPQVATPPWAAQAPNGAQPAAEGKKPRRANTSVQDVQG